MLRQCMAPPNAWCCHSINKLLKRLLLDDGSGACSVLKSNTHMLISDLLQYMCCTYKGPPINI